MITRKQFLQRTGAAGLAAAMPVHGAHAAETPQRPNILWISTEDISSHLGCYGAPNAITPTLDKLASEGVRYSHFFTVAPVCAPNRSCIITGMYPQTIGTHPMRSGGEGAKSSDVPILTPPLRCFPEYLREAGYYCTNNSKEDYNFQKPDGVWDASNKDAHWRNRPNPNQPFFAVFNATVTHESANHVSLKEHARRTAMLTAAQRQDPAKITPPPYHADTPLIRESWARYFETITAMDYWAVDLLQQLEDDGLAENTIVVFWSDHGDGMPRCKRWCRDSGSRAPMIARIPEAFRVEGQGVPGTTDERLVSSVDFAPTMLKLAGLPVPETMQGQAFLGPYLPPARKYVYCGRDRMDERQDTVRSVRTTRYRYVRNYQPWLPYNQHLNYGEKHPIQREMRRLAAKGALPPGAAWFTAKRKPFEELYDSENDPHEMTNLADDPAYQEILKELAMEHWRFLLESEDLGLIPEPELSALGEQYGGRFNIARELKKTDPDFLNSLRRAAMDAALPTPTGHMIAEAQLLVGIPSERYWAVTGLGNNSQSEEAKEYVADALDDESATVRVAAALALFKMNYDTDKALEVLKNEIQSRDKWIRHQAALALDEIGEAARPLLPLLREAMKDHENKYVEHVLTHAVEALAAKKELTV